MRSVGLLFIILIVACHSQKRVQPDADTLYKEYLLIDSLANSRPDSAFYYYNKAAQNASDSVYKGTWLQRMAEIQQQSGDYFGSNETAISSLALFDSSKSSHFPNISFNYNLLASNCLELGRYDDALVYYDLAFRYSDSSNLSIFKNNKGVAYQKKKEYDQAITLYEEALADSLNEEGVYARIRSNLAKARWLKDPRYPAAAEFHEARKIREESDDKWGMNASYSHLADYYQDTHPDSASWYAQKMYRVAKELNSPDDQAEALEKLIRVSSGSQVKSYFDKLDFISDSLRLARSNAKSQFADIRFAAEEARANNLLLEKDNSQKRLRITRQRIIIYSTLLIFSLFVFGGIIWYRKRKKLQEIQTRNAVRESELKTSKKIHDVVANGLYQIMTQLEHHEGVQKEKLLDNIEDLYERSRDISYEPQAVSAGSFADSLNEMMTSFATAETKVLLVGNEDPLWAGIKDKFREELFYIMQELLVNMKKHSEARNVVIRFQESQEGLTIHYKDDGRGLSADYQPGNGMRNTGNRIQEMGGRIIFGNNEGKGLRVEILIPKSKTA